MPIFLFEMSSEVSPQPTQFMYAWVAPVFRYSAVKHGKQGAKISENCFIHSLVHNGVTINLLNLEQNKIFVLFPASNIGYNIP
jgi:hypothetical protein